MSEVDSIESKKKKKNVSQKEEIQYFEDCQSLFYSDKRPSDPNVDFYYARIIRSTVPKGRIKAVTLPILPKDYHVLTAKDIPGKNQIITEETICPVFAYDNIQYEGEPIGLFVGPDREIVNHLLTQITVEYSILPEQEETPVENTILYTRTITFGDAEDIYKKSELHLDKTYNLNLKNYNCGEPEGAYVEYSKDTLSIYTPTQWPKHLNDNMLSVIGLDQKKLQIIKTKHTNTDNKNIWYNTLTACQVAVAAFSLKSAVLLVFSEHEEDFFAKRNLPITLQYQTAYSNDGTIISAIININIKTGAFCPFAKLITNKLILSSCNAYKPQNLKITASINKTPTPPVPVLLAKLDSHTFFAIETHINEIIGLLKLDPIEVRQKNLFPSILKTRFEYPFILEGELLLPIFETIVKQSDFNRKYVSYSNTSPDNSQFFSPIPSRGIGFSSGFEGNGFYDSSLDIHKQSISITMETDGSIVIHTHKPSHSIIDIWVEQVCSILEVTPTQVRIESSIDTEDSILPETITGNISVLTQLIKKCCIGIQKLRFRQALPITIRKSLSKPKKQVWNTETFSGIPYYSVSWGAAVIEIELDRLSYRVIIKNIWLCIDIGSIMNKKQAELAVKRSIEDIMFILANGCQFNPDNLFISFIKSDNEPKQIGDIVMNLIPSAFIAALSQAMGKYVNSLPIRTDTIYNYLKEI